MCKDETYIIKSSRSDAAHPSQQMFPKTVEGSKQALIVEEFSAETCSETSNDSQVRDFWDAFEEDGMDDEVFSDQRVCYSPCDVLVTSVQLLLATLLVLLTILSLSTLQLCLVVLTRSTNNQQEQTINKMVILSVYVLPVVISLPYLLYNILYRGMSKKLPVSRHALLAVSSCLDVYSLYILVECLLPQLDVIESLLMMTILSGGSQVYKLVQEKIRTSGCTNSRSLLDSTSLATLVLLATALSITYRVYFNYDLYTCLLVPTMLISSSLSVLIESFQSQHSQKLKNTRQLSLTVSKLTCAAFYYWISMASVPTLEASVPTYISVSSAGLCISPLLLYGLVWVIKTCKLSKSASTGLALGPPLAVLSILTFSSLVTSDVCLRFTANSTQCEAPLSLTSGFTLDLKFMAFLIVWFWSYLTVLPLHTDNSSGQLSSLRMHMGDSYAFASFNSAPRTNERLHTLSTSTLPVYTNMVNKSSQSSYIPNATDGHVTSKLYLCATLWHENRQEVIQFLTSTFKLDEHQCMKRQTMDLLANTDHDITDPDYFEFETHVMFDDAMSWNTDGNRAVNSFVSEFIQVLQETAVCFHGSHECLELAEKYPTPYGGQLKVTLPGGNLLVVHLKDKLKIRNKKRWSMIQYMYYLLGYRLLSEHPEDYGKMDHQGIPCKTKQEADNSFLLTVDGDVEFEPDAIQQLLTQIRKCEQVGVVCGRIHPMGSGLLVWYQRFEYAIAHWLHKTAENVLGVVLCTPGAFSMFRASALMDRNVLRTFTREVETGLNALQYEQGEDRWLCSLLFQQGHRCEYVPTASARTFAPQTLIEFFNQRRRWALSSVVNQYDLLAKWRSSYLKNRDISVSYVLFEAVLFLSTILGPSYVILFLAYANSTVFEVDLESSYLLSVLPPAVYTVLCMILSRDNQVNVAYILSIYYACLSSLYLTLNVFSMIDYKIYSPLILMMIVVGSLFTLTAILHPSEICDLLPVCLYYMMIPTTYMILMIYCVINLNIISWGTRETSSNNEKRRQRCSKARDDLVNPSWIESSGLQGFMLKHLDENELLFWKRLIKGYLKPHSHSEETKATLQADLLDLRNKSIVSYYVVNGLTVYMCYKLQENGHRVKLSTSVDSDIDPVALICVLIFGLLALAQFLCLVYLRASKLITCIASSLRLRRTTSSTNPHLNTAQSVIEHLKKLQLSGSQFKRKPLYEANNNNSSCRFTNLSKLIIGSPTDTTLTLLDV